MTRKATATKAAPTPATEEDLGGSTDIIIDAPKLQTLSVRIRGTAPYVQNKFSQKARQAMIDKHIAGSVAQKGKKREPKNFQKMYDGALHVGRDGTLGMPAPAFRAALISACRLVGFKMTLAKLSVFVLHDTVDKDDATPLVRITKGEPRVLESVTRLANGQPDVIWRPCWDEWEAVLRIVYDADQFSATDITNLLMRVGQQVGIGCGRPDSRTSTGQGWGTFEIVNDMAAVVPLRAV